MRWIGIGVMAMAMAMAVAGPGGKQEAFVRVSGRDARYFELSDGRPCVPIGLNMIRPPWVKDDPAKEMAGFDAWLKRLSDNGGNFVRIWCSAPFWDVEHERSGRYDEAKAKLIDQALAMARKRGVREILRYKPGRPVLLAESGAVEPSHSGPFKLYAKDKAGIILHDVLFAPFFAGAAGPGQAEYVAVGTGRGQGARGAGGGEAGVGGPAEGRRRAGRGPRV